MTFSNPWFTATLLGVVLLFHLDLLVALLNVRQFAKPLPPRMAALYDEEKLKLCAEYHGRSARLDLMRDSFFLAVLLMFWLFGGFAWLDRWSTALPFGTVWNGVAAIAALLLTRALLALPFDAWDTFGVETEFGFNRTTPGTFIADRLKGLFLSALLGLPLLALVLWFFQTQRWAAAYAWGSLAIFSLLMTWLAPRLIMPLFMKFQPLEDGGLKQAILDLAARLHFPVAEVSVVDGSRRSSKANAFFAGFGRTRRIALFDTLVSSHEQDELLAVLAHEIGHSQRGHVPRHLAVGLLESALLFALLHFALQAPGLYQAFGVSGQPIALGLVFFSLLYRPAALLLSLISSALSRRHEYEADAYAREAMGSATPLVTALQKLSTDHLAHPWPHPLAVALHYSHPPLQQRLAALESSPA
ncbi:MAG: M48 family metallopeptidase [Verrucomicrobiales bacterium]|nr:M48 family metallopeptidase [Verrucomicrobiales bacterium]